MKLTLTSGIIKLFLLLCFSGFTISASGQCMMGTGPNPASTFAPTCNYTNYDLTSTGIAGQYSFVGVTAGNQYTFSSSNNTDFLTISDENGATALAWGVTPVVWTATTTGNIRFYSHANSACVVQNIHRTRSVRCGNPPPLPVSCATLLLPADGATNVAPNPNVKFSWNTVAGATAYKLYVGTSVAGAIMRTNITATETILWGFALNTTYYWYVVPSNISGDVTGCSATASSFTMASTANNDDCANAIEIVLPMSGTNYGSSAGATQSMPPCVGSVATDIWYKTTITNGGSVAIDAASNDHDAVLQVFSGTCGNLTSVACVNATGVGGLEQYTVTGSPGSTFYFRFYSLSGVPSSYMYHLSGSVLPVTMDKLNGRIRADNHVELTWGTYSEKNNKGFEMQRSIDGKTFEAIGFVKSQGVNGNSDEKKEYNFVDATKLTGMAYYRLLQTDIDGKITTSNTLSLTGKPEASPRLVASPNPVKNKLTLSVTGLARAPGRLRITNLAGETKLLFDMNKEEMVIDMGDLPAGIYLLQYIDAFSCQTIKISKE